MEELQNILAEHAARYPRMQPQDAVKLLYQNEFGGGHLIRDREASLIRLREESAQVKHDPAALLLEDIGGGLVRLHLAAWEEAVYPLETLNRDFADSAERHRGSLPSFLGKLELLRAMTAEGIFGFSSDALEAYLANYAARGYPMVSHSEEFREAYAPAYRVLLRELAERSMKTD